MHRAEGAFERTAKQEAWRALLTGKLVVSEHLKGTDARTIIAKPVGRGSHPNALSSGEVDLAERRARGAPLKVLATHAGCAVSTIGASLLRTRQKLKLGTEAELATFFLSTEVLEALRDPVVATPTPGPTPTLTSRAPREAPVTATHLRLLYATPRFDIPARLSDAEGCIILGLIAGSPAYAIARARGVSPRTVANQTASAYRKLGVGSRIEMFATLLKPDRSGVARRSAHSHFPQMP
jgi:DNA-binding NarL/FixJ family response regulator